MPKSILKNPSAPAAGELARGKDDRARETALYHARLIHQRKDVEAQILADVELLLDLPSSAQADPGCPSGEDVTAFVRGLELFQPSDFDALVEERNINNHCGYPLCSRNRRLQDTNAKYRILLQKGKGANAMRFVETKSLEKWCSDECGRRALYVRVQLNGEPAWARLGKHSPIRLPVEEDGELVQGLRELSMKEEDTLEDRMRALALERGDEKSPARANGLAVVKEKDISSSAQNFRSVGSHRAIEGYQSSFGDRNSRRHGDDDDEDVLETI